MGGGGETSRQTDGWVLSCSVTLLRATGLINIRLNISLGTSLLNVKYLASMEIKTGPLSLLRLEAGDER